MMPFTHDAVCPERVAPDRECNCPAWVIRCAHFGTKIEVLLDTSINPHRAPCYHSSKTWEQRFFVFPVYGWRRCDIAGCPGSFNAGRGKVTYKGDSEADAPAAFYAAEEELLRGGAEDA